MPLRRTSRWLPLIPVAAHTILTLLVFLVALRNPIRSGMLPLVVATVDLPFSIVIEMVASYVVRDGLGYSASLLNDMSWFLVLGGAWWYGIGWGAVFLMNRTRSLTKRTM